MPLQFREPFQIQPRQDQTKSDTVVDLSNAAIGVVDQYQKYKSATQKEKFDALQARREAAHKDVEQKINLLKLGQGTDVLDPVTGKVVGKQPGVTGWEIVIDNEGITHLVKSSDIAGPQPEGAAPVPVADPGAKKVQVLPSPKPLAVSEDEKATAKLNAKIAAEKPKATGSYKDALQGFDSMIREAKAIRDDKDLPSASGYVAGRIKLPGGGTRVAARLETLKAKTLLNVLSSLKELSRTGASGFGQLSEIEGENIRNSISTLDRKQSTEDLQASIDRFIVEMEQKRQNLIDTFQSTYGNAPGDKSSAPTPSSKDVGRFTVTVE